ncbi:hypothetical protein A2Z22_03920 [Candidatus Woesebacteria bacterium RBG_16_34_12]|uniref:Uncharacterized protein n=1 Tax=Candidatus Woesebacteria bacterium RBG_16_34_12 TaxID=1802480 RepID=A0A1F7X7F0_9BACT|nr:MAG: hypothetical protein A2Z22_03920 [Candidatus Woesebacteria bacterium RBG_16_34_12]
MIKGDRDIPVSPNNVPPSGCPNHGLKSTEQCVGPTNSSICLEFCRLGLEIKRRVAENQIQPQTTIRQPGSPR